MTRAVFRRRNGALCGFTVTGHTDASGEEQARLVCAAISSAAYLVANTITEILGAPAEAGQDDAVLYLRLAGEHAQAEALLRGLLLHYEELAKQYPNYIQVITEV